MSQELGGREEVPLAALHVQRLRQVDSNLNSSVISRSQVDHR